MEDKLLATKSKTKYGIGANILFCIGLYLFVSIVYIMAYCTNFVLNYRPVTICMIVAICITIVGNFIYSRKTSKTWINYESLVCMVIIIGIIMRIGYMLYFSFTDGYDVTINTVEIINEDEISALTTSSKQLDMRITKTIVPNGHAGYVLQLLKNASLPKDNSYQFYQQPLSYFMYYLTIVLINSFLSISDESDLIEISKIVSCCFSCFVLPLSKYMLEYLGISDKSKLISLSIIAFVPNFYIVSSYISPDSIPTLFIMLSIMYTLLWMDDHSWKNTIILALIYGLGMMSKISCAVIAPITASVFVIYLLKEKRKEILGLKYLLFSLISFPLGLWYNVRNLVLFKQPIGYVYKQSVNLDSYIGNHSFLDRLLLVNINELLSSPFVFQKSDYSLISFLIKSSLFGGYNNYDSPYIIVAYVLFFVTLVLIVILLIVFVLSICKLLISHNKYTILLISIIIISCLAIVAFNIKEPFTSTMSFRYYAYIVLPVSVLAAMGYDSCENRHIKDCLEIFVLLYSICSCAYYLI